MRWWHPRRRELCPSVGRLCHSFSFARAPRTLNRLLLSLMTGSRTHAHMHTEGGRETNTGVGVHVLHLMQWLPGCGQCNFFSPSSLAHTPTQPQLKHLWWLCMCCGAAFLWMKWGVVVAMPRQAACWLVAVQAQHTSAWSLGCRLRRGSKGRHAPNSVAPPASRPPRKVSVHSRQSRSTASRDCSVSAVGRKGVGAYKLSILRVDPGPGNFDLWRQGPGTNPVCPCRQKGPRAQSQHSTPPTPLHSTPLHSTPLHSTPLHSTPLHSTPLHSTPLHSTPLHSTPLHSTPLQSTHSTPLHSTKHSCWMH